jgi:hypothetical protein
MLRTLPWCYPAFRHIRRVVVVDLYAVALERLPAGASILFENGEAAFLQAAQAIAWQLGVGGPQSYSVEEATVEVAYTPPIPSAQQPGRSQARQD